MTTDSLFTATPGTTDADDGQPINTGTTFRVTAAVSCTHHRFYAPATGAGTVTARLYEYVDEENTPILLAEKAYVSVNAGAYNSVAWDTPVPLTTGKYYLAQHHASGGHYVATGSAFGADVTSAGGLVVAIATGSATAVGTLRNGKFKYGAAAFADQNGSSTNFFDDVIVSDAGDVDGELAATLPALTGALTGVLSLTGVLAGSLPMLTGALDGALSVPGALTGTLPALVGVLDGVVVAPATGVLNGVLPALVGAVAVSVDNPAGGGLDVAAVMQAIADRVDTIVGLRVFAWPPGSLTPPAAVVGYPEEIVYDLTYGRGADRMTVPLVVVVGKATERTTPARLGQYASSTGSKSVKQVLDVDGWDHPAFDEVRVARAVFDAVSIGGIEYMAALFDLEIFGSGGG